MSNSLARHSGQAGLCAALLGVIGIIIAGYPPDASSSIDQLREFVHHERASILINAAIFQLTIPFLFVFAAGLSRVASGTNSEQGALAWGGFAGNVGLQAVAISGFIPIVAAAWRGADDALVRVAYDSNLLGLYAMTAGFSLASVVPVTMAGIITKALPAWIAIFALVVAAANIAELIGLVFFDSGPMALGAGAGLVAVPAWLAWMAAVSVALLIRRTAAP